MKSLASKMRLAAMLIAVLSLAKAVPVHAAGPAVAQAGRAAEKSAGGLQSHRAVYDIALTKISNSDGVRAATGTMTYTLTDRCEGYTVESNLIMTLAMANGNVNKVDQRYAAWEAKDGKSSTFRMQALENGKVNKAYSGNIQFKDDGIGTATYQGDETTKFDLPRGTLLSTAHTQALLKSAAAHEKFVSRMVIDGSFDEGPFWVTASIAGPHDNNVKPAKNGPNKNGAEAPGAQFWPIALAYFPAKSSQTLPEYEIAQNLLSSGVTRSMSQDFGGFTLAFNLVRIEPITLPPC